MEFFVHVTLIWNWLYILIQKQALALSCAHVSIVGDISKAVCSNFLSLHTTSMYMFAMDIDINVFYSAFRSNATLSRIIVMW